MQSRNTAPTGPPWDHTPLLSRFGVSGWRGRLLVLAQIATLAILALDAVLLIASTPDELQQLQRVCVRCDEPHLTTQSLNQLHTMGLGPAAFATFFTGFNTAIALVCFAVGVIIFWRRFQSLQGLLGAIALCTFLPIDIIGIPTYLAAAHPTWQTPFSVATTIGFISFFGFFYIFPTGRFPRWAVWVAVASFASGAAHALLPRVIPDISNNAIWILLVFGSVIGLQIYRYFRVSSPEQRQQTKWVVFGLVAAIAGWVLTVSLAALTGHAGRLQTLQAVVAGTTVLYLFILLIPLSIGLAILRYRLWDIDVLVNRTLVYASLTILLALIYVGGVIALQALFRTVTGQGSSVAVAISTLAIAALFQPLRRQIQGFIDRRFYRRKYDAARTLAGFQTRLRNEVDLDELVHDLVGVVQETMQPAHVSIWLRHPEGGV
jgi:hypothetical protein